MDSRDLQPELLDGLPLDDPRAIASRRDLRMINTLMGNYAWLADRLGEEAPFTDVSELGAGDGGLAKHRTALTQLGVTGFDLGPLPARWAASWEWEEGDVLEAAQLDKIGTSEVVVASLFIHHLDLNQLGQLGAAIQSPAAKVRRLLFTEPARYIIHSWQGYLLYPLGINEVTRHDLQASIRAGFQRGEIARGMDLDPGLWKVTESRTFFGAHRFEAVRTAP